MAVICYIVYQVRYIYHKPWNSATSKAAERYRLGASSCALERWFFCRMEIGSYPNSSHVRSPVAFTFTWRRTKRAKRNAKRGRRKCVPVDPLVLAMWRVFGGPFCSHVSEQKHRFWDCSRHCVQSVSLAIPISYLLTSCMISISRFFPKCSCHAMCVLFINAVMLYNDACWSRLHEDSSDVLDLTVDVVLCDKCSSLNLCFWGMITWFGADTCDLPCRRFGRCTCAERERPNVMQTLCCCQVGLFEVVLHKLHMQ